MEAHAIGYVHRDLRPRNVYLAVRRGKANFVKLLDFGLAKLVETDAQAASTSLGMTFGDPRYMSPEQARGDRIDRRADIYQLGCVAYEMLTGAPPFTGNRVFDILTKQVTETPAPLPTRAPGVPLWMEAAVAKMLAKDPENRFATTTRMVEALRRGLETGEVMEDEIARRRESIPPPIGVARDAAHGHRRATRRETAGRRRSRRRLRRSPRPRKPRRWRRGAAVAAARRRQALRRAARERAASHGDAARRRAGVGRGASRSRRRSRTTTAQTAERKPTADARAAARRTRIERRLGGDLAGLVRGRRARSTAAPRSRRSSDQVDARAARSRRRRPATSMYDEDRRRRCGAARGDRRS